MVQTVIKTKLAGYKHTQFVLVLSVKNRG